MSLDITRDTFDLSLDYHKLLFQRNKPVLDSELNEMQDAIRIRNYLSLRPFGTDGSSPFLDYAEARTMDAFRVLPDGGGADQIFVNAGELLAHGYLLRMPVATSFSIPFTIAGKYTVYLTINEVDVDAGTDPGIAVSALGETTQRRQVTYTVDTIQGDIPADSGGEVWEGGTVHVMLAQLYRTASGIVTSQEIIDRRALPSQVRAAQDRNIVMDLLPGGYVKWDLATTTASISGLHITIPGTPVSTAVELGSSNTDVVITAGQGFGFFRDTSDSEDSRIRRRGTAYTMDSTSGPDSSNVVLQAINFQVDNNPESFNDDLYVMGFHDTDTGDLVLRNGTRVKDGDVCTDMKGQTHMLTDRTTTPTPGPRVVSAIGETLTYVDPFGFQGGAISTIEENWIDAGNMSGMINDSQRYELDGATSGGVNISLRAGSNSALTGTVALPQTYSGRVATMNPGGETISDVRRLAISHTFNWYANTAFMAALEFELFNYQALSTGMNTTLVLGIVGNNSGSDYDPATMASAVIFKDNTLDRYQVKVSSEGGGPAAAVPVGIAGLAAGSATRVKIVFVGANALVSGGTDTVYFYINGVLAATFTGPEVPAEVPTNGSELRPFWWQLYGTGLGASATDCQWSVGEWTFRKRRMLPGFYF